MCNKENLPQVKNHWLKLYFKLRVGDIQPATCFLGLKTICVLQKKLNILRQNLQCTQNITFIAQQCFINENFITSSLIYKKSS